MPSPDPTSSQPAVPAAFDRSTARAPDHESPLPRPRIRAATPDDAEALLAIYAPYVRDTAITFEYEVPSREEFAGRIAATLARYPYLAAEREGRAEGYAYVSPFSERAAYGWSVETSIYVDRSLRRGGVGRALYEALEASLRAMGILNANACIGVPRAEDAEDEHLTDDSVRFHEHMGYRLVGRFHQCGYKFGRWYDMVWMEKMLGEHVTGQPAVRPFAEVLPGLRASGALE